MATTITISSPKAYQVFQRDGIDKADIIIAGTYTDADPASIEARWQGGAWADIGATIAAGAFNGALAAQSAGQGLLEVRDAGNSSVTDSVAYIGIGDVFVVAGQSNASGRGSLKQAYTHATLRAGMFRQDDAWRELADPTDTEVLAQNRGSPWPLVATHVMAQTGFPVAFVTAATGGTGIVLEPENTWAKPAAEYTDLVETVTNSGINGARCLLWHQGEQDVGNEVSRPQYYDAIVDLLGNVHSDAPALATTPIMVAQIGHMASRDTVFLDYVRADQMALWDDAIALPGPVCYDIDLADNGGDGIHFKTNAELAMLAARWWRMISHAFFGGTDGRAPRVQSASLHAADTIDIVFDRALAAASTDAWMLADAAGDVPLASATVESSTTLRIVCERTLVGVVRGTFASGNSGVNTTILDTAAITMPIEPIYDATLAAAAAGWWR